MNKQEFLDALKIELGGLPEADIEERLEFYSEIIDDGVEDGLSEDAVISKLGSVEDLAMQIIADTPLIKIAKEKIKPKRRLKAWEIVLIALGSPIWGALLIALFAVALSIYISVWSVIISLWAVFGAFIGSAFGALVIGISLLSKADIVAGIAVIGIGIFSAGIGIFSFFGCRAATKGLILLTKKIMLSIKKRCVLGGADL